jgi:hypothetical protein
MVLRVTTQQVDTWKKRIQRDGLKGSTYFCHQGGSVWVSASADLPESFRKGFRNKFFVELFAVG